MFEEWWPDGPVVEEPPLGPMPVEDPVFVAQREAYLDSPEFAREQEELWAAELASMSPAERFEREYGLPALPEHGFVPADSVEAVAAATQDRFVQLDRVARIAEAHAVVGLLAAYEASVEDLATRFSVQLARRDGLGVQAFFRSMGLLTQTHPQQVASRLDTAVDARDRLPETWQVFLTGDTTWRRIALTVKQLAGLDPQHWAAFDAGAAKILATSTRPARDLHRLRERLQDDTAATRAKTVYEQRNVVLEPGPDGRASLVITGPATDLVPFAQALHRTAVTAHGTDRQGRGVRALEYDIVTDLLRCGIRHDCGCGDRTVPDRTPVDIRLVLTIPALAWLGRTTEQATLDGYGPIDLDTAKDLAGSATSMIRVLTDPITGVRLTMDRTVYSPPADLNRWVRIRDGRSRFPGGTRPAWLCDIDHAREWQHGGATEGRNLVCISRPEHNLKSAGLFIEHLRHDGAVPWRDPWGHEFIDPPPDPQDPAPINLLPPHTPTTDNDDPPPF